ncbi:hypothetical protein MW887_010794 [Aspergillus wentii]|nr:hypothetical protein MW887_010794 [Aspergillus wentii]
MQHDIYSIGACLLEIGLWESLIAYGSDRVATPSSAFAGYGVNLNPKEPVRIKNSLAALAKDALPKKVGRKYAQIAFNCLICLDNVGDQSEFEDEDSVLVAVRYIEKV